MNNLTLKSKILGAIVLVVVLYFGLAHFGYVPGARVKQAEVPTGFDLPTAPDGSESKTALVAAVPLPTANVASVVGPTIRVNIWAWNAQMGLIFANGGPQTTQGSLMEKHKVKMRITRVDDTEKSKAAQIKFAELLKTTSEPTDGVNYVVIMGDGAAQYLSSINKELSRIGPEYRAEIVGAVGYSRGEDALMGPEEWKTNPESMKGGVCAGVLRDGDWNIGQYYLAQNGILNNPNEHTYDPNALNWVGTDDYVKAAEMYAAGYSEDRDVVSNGKKTGAKKHITVQCAVTWTPGDVTIAKKRGGLIKILSTKENVYQMPAVIIGIHKWNAAHAMQVENMLTAAYEGADQVRNYSEALVAAGKASHAIYKEETPAYWVKYYRGVVERDAKGISVPLGGSTVMNLADNLLLFGIAKGSGGTDASLFKASYEGFGNIAKQQYPDLISSFPTASEAVDLKYLQDLANGADSTTTASVEQFDATPIAQENVVGKKNWHIEFLNGKHDVTPEGAKVLTDLYTVLQQGGGLQVEIQGHTDNTGNPDANMQLSEERAFAVKDFLQKKAPVLFPDSRIQTKAFGQTQPLVPNTSNENRAKNRRVTVVLGAR